MGSIYTHHPCAQSVRSSVPLTTSQVSVSKIPSDWTDASSVFITGASEPLHRGLGILEDLVNRFLLFDRWHE